MSDLDLARRLVACPRWPRIQSDGSYQTVDGALTFREHDIGRLWIDGRGYDWLPDLDDAATVGCVEALVQQVLGHDGVSVVVVVRWTSTSLYRVTRWTDSSAERKTEGWGWTPLTIGGNDHPTKIGALIAALESL